MKIVLIALTVILSGCGTMITVPVDPKPISQNAGTIVVYADEGWTDTFPIFVDKKPVGSLISEKYLKVEVPAGDHEIYASLPMNIIDEITKFNIKNGETKFFKLHFELGWWVSNIWTYPTEPITSYQVKSHRQ